MAARRYFTGYALSLLLTAAAFWLALAGAVPPAWLLPALVGLGVVQIVVQLFLFMHVTEAGGRPYHLAVLVPSLVFTFAIAIMSIWIMSFGGARVA